MESKKQLKDYNKLMKNIHLKQQITKHKIEEWLKSSHTEEVDVDNVIEMIYDIATGGYSVERLRKDVIDYYNGNWKYMEDNK